MSYPYNKERVTYLVHPIITKALGLQNGTMLVNFNPLWQIVNRYLGISPRHLDNPAMDKGIIRHILEQPSARVFVTFLDGIVPNGKDDYTIASRMLENVVSISYVDFDLGIYLTTFESLLLGPTSRATRAYQIPPRRHAVLAPERLVTQRAAPMREEASDILSSGFYS